MTDDTIKRFKSELNSFFVLVLLNMVIGALVMAVGIQFVVSLILGLSGLQTTGIVRALTGAFSLVCFGLGLMWVLSSARIMRGITGIRKEYRAHADPVSADTLTGWIVRLIAHYRENKKRIGWMIIISALSGSVFLALGVLNGVQGIWAADTITRLLSFVAAAVNLTIGLVSLRLYRYFRNYSAAWDRRLEEAARSEDTLQHAMELR